MIRQILGWLLATIVVIAIIVWIIGGGLTRTINYARSLTSAGSYFNLNASSSGQEFRLPGQPDYSTYGANTLNTDTGYRGDETVYTDSAPSNNSNTPSGSTNFAGQDDPRMFGNPSPYARQVTFTGHSVGNGSASTEYVQLANSGASPGAISLRGWTLQSALSGARVLVPQATKVFVQGVLNPSGAPLLDPGSSAVIITGSSPTGVSFQENRCSGYLAQFQTFSPPLNSHCPVAAENARAQSADPACFEYLSSIPMCHFPGGSSTQNQSMSGSCRELAADIFSYNGCVAAYRTVPGFALPSWRLYLSVATPLWKPTHDTIRLLDAEGRVVDVLNY